MRNAKGYGGMVGKQVHTSSLLWNTPALRKTRALEKDYLQLLLTFGSTLDGPPILISLLGWHLCTDFHNHNTILVCLDDGVYP